MTAHQAKQSPTPSVAFLIDADNLSCHPFQRFSYRIDQHRSWRHGRQLQNRRAMQFSGSIRRLCLSRQTPQVRI